MAAINAPVTVQSLMMPAQPSSVNPLAMLRVTSRSRREMPRLFLRLTSPVVWPVSSVW